MKKTIIIAAIMLLVAGTASLDARTKKKATTKKTASTSQVIYTGDIATGATYTSEALIKNIQMGLDQSKSTSTAKSKKATKKKSTKKRR